MSFLILQRGIRNYGVDGTNVMNISEAFDCLPHHLIFAEVHTYSMVLIPSVFS